MLRRQHQRLPMLLLLQLLLLEQGWRLLRLQEMALLGKIVTRAVMMMMMVMMMIMMMVGEVKTG